MSTPSEVLAHKIIERLIAENLLTQNDGERMVTKLAAGRLRAEDWRLPIELATARVANQQPTIGPTDGMEVTR